MLGLLRLKSKKGGIVGASSGTLPVWVGIRPCEKAPRNWGKGLRTRRPKKQQWSRLKQGKDAAYLLFKHFINNGQTGLHSDPVSKTKQNKIQLQNSMTN
jgi:hypothetical protein